MKEQAEEKRGKEEEADVLVIPINMLLLDANKPLPVSLQEFFRFPAAIVLGAKAVFVLRHALSFKPAGAQLSNESASLQWKTYQHGRTRAGCSMSRASWSNESSGVVAEGSMKRLRIGAEEAANFLTGNLGAAQRITSFSLRARPL